MKRRRNSGRMSPLDLVLYPNFLMTLPFNAHDLWRKRWNVNCSEEGCTEFRWRRVTEKILQGKLGGDCQERALCAGRTMNRSPWLERTLPVESLWTQHSWQIAKGFNSSPRSGLYLLGNGESRKLFEHRVMRRSTWWKRYFRKITLAVECRQRLVARLLL